MKLIIIGIQGSGKGTQSKLISKEYNLQHISTGDAIRKEISSNSELGKRFKEYSDAGKLVPDSLVNEILQANLPQDNYLLDGYPRNLSQAEFLEENNAPEKIIYLELPEEEVMNRLSNRFVCKTCKIDYGLNNMPQAPGICNKCQGKIERRKDDADESAIKKRIEEFKNETLPLLKFYSERVLTIDGNQTVEEVFSDIQTALN